MNRTWIKSFLILASLVVYSHAIFGIGGQLAPNLGAKVDSDKGYMAGTEGNPNINLNQKSISGLSGFGVKLWIDVIPIIELELASNLQFRRYDVSLDLECNNAPNCTDASTPLVVETGLPFFEEARPIFGKISSDLSIKYPFLKFPPAVKLLKLYVGAGLTHVLSVPILDSELAKDAVEDVDFSTINALSTAEASTEIVKYFTKEGELSSGFGGHVLVGARVKPPVIPIAVYVDGKFHFGGGLPDAVSSGLTLELGAALAF